MWHTRLGHKRCVAPLIENSSHITYVKSDKNANRGVRGGDTELLHVIPIRTPSITFYHYYCS